MRNFVFILIFGYFNAISSFSCPNGFIEIPKEHKCVYANVEALYYPKAVRKCKDLGGDVVKIQNVFENAILFGLLGEEFNRTTPFIGVEKLTNGTWAYSDGSPLTYTNWAPAQPSSANSEFTCVMMDPQTALWWVAGCSIARPFFCQVDGNDFECDSGWAYLEKTDSCYYLQNFTYQDGVHWQLYSWNDAEGNCRRMNSHLVSIHSKEEDDFIYDLVYTSFKDINPNPAPEVFSSYLWTYIGLDAKAAKGDYWTDGSPFDYFDGSDNLPNTPVVWGIANNPNYARRWGWMSTNEPRYICKKAAEN